MLNQPQRHHAFTLIELLVVISIITLLISLLLPALGNAKESANIALCASNLRQLSIGLLAYADDRGGALPPLRPSSNNQTSNHWPRWFRVVGGAHPEYWNLGFIWRDGYIEDGRTFYCPSQEPGGPFAYDTYANPQFPADILGGATGVRISYMYNPVTQGLAAALRNPQPQTSARDRRRILGNSSRVREYASVEAFEPGALLGLDNAESVETVAHFKAPGWNTMFADTSVRFARDKQSLEMMRNVGGNFSQTDYITFDAVLTRLIQAR